MTQNRSSAQVADSAASGRREERLVPEKMPVVPEWRLGPDWEGEAAAGVLLRVCMECAHRCLSASAVTGEMKEVIHVAPGGALCAVGDNAVAIDVLAVEIAQPSL